MHNGFIMMCQFKQQLVEKLLTEKQYNHIPSFSIHNIRICTMIQQ